jgi:hypothetical protein
MDDTFILGQPKYRSKSRISMAKHYGPLSVGDVVAPWKFYKNGKPIQQEHWDYKDPINSMIGVVIGEGDHVSGEKHYEILIVKWTSRDTKNGIYVKETSGSYLTKLS